VAKTLLLADDSVTIQRVIELTFADEDIRVVAVGDGDQAIAAIDKAPPDIVLADVGMPGRNGYQVAEHIKRTPHLAHIPVLLLTGAFEPIDQARAADAGCDGVLAKPFEPQMVIGRVKELLTAAPAPLPPQSSLPSIAFDLDALAPPPAPAPAPEWPAMLGDAPASVPPAAALSAPEDVDHYFDRLDRAFANLSNSHDAPGAPAPTRAIVADQIDWFSTTAPADTPSAPAEAGEPASVAEPAAPAAAPQPVHAMPPLADAFAALLAAEQSVVVTPSTPWAGLTPDVPAAAAPPATISEEVIEDIVRRVLDRLSDRVVRETVTDIVSGAAERLVKEEIARIKDATNI